MRTTLLMLIFLIASNCFGQSYSERYDEIQERYEYYDSNNQLIGYKKWDVISREWKYTDLTQQKQPRRSPYADIKPINTSNADLAHKVLATKQRRYDANINRIQIKINELRNNLRDPQKIKIFDQSVRDLQEKNPNLDYSSSQVTTSVINHFIQSYNALIKPSSSKPRKSSSSSSTSSNITRKSSNTTSDSASEYYNTGLKFENQNKTKEAINFYELAILKKPDHFDSYFGISRIILNGEQEIINEMNSLGSSNEDNKRFSELNKRRKKLYREVMPYLEKAHEIRPNDEKVKKTLDNIMSQLSHDKDSAKSDKNLNSNIESKPNIIDGYRANKILEFTFNKGTGKFELDKELDVNSKLFFANDYYAFKRGNEPWKSNEWTYSGFDKKGQLFVFYDNYGNTVVFDKNLTYIAWYFDLEGDQFNGRIIYTGLKKDSSVVMPKN